MRIDFNAIEMMTIPSMNNGTGMMSAQMYDDEKYRIIPTSIHPGGSIGVHMQSSGDDMNYILSGEGKVVCDGVEEELKPLLEDKFHLIAPDYPGFGQSESTARETFEYTFDHINRNFWQSGGKMILRSSGQELNLLKKICRMRRLFR